MVTITEITEILSRACGYRGEILNDTELIDSGLLDSLAFIKLAYELEDVGVTLNMARVSNDDLQTPQKIMELIANTR